MRSGRQRPRHGQERVLARLAHHRPPARRRPGHDPGAQQRALAGAGGADHRQQPPARDLSPQLRDLLLAAEEVVGVGLGERRQPRVRRPLVGSILRARRQHAGVGVRTSTEAHLRNQPVAAPVDGLDVARLAGVILQRLAQLGDSPRDRVVGDELGLPDRILDLPLVHHLAGSPGQVDEEIHDLALDLNRGGAARDPVQARLDQPVAEREPGPRRRDSLDCGGHAVAIISRSHGTRHAGGPAPRVTTTRKSNDLRHRRPPANQRRLGPGRGRAPRSLATYIGGIVVGSEVVLSSTEP